MAFNFIKKETPAQVFSLNLANFLRRPNLWNTSGWLLLSYLLLHYCCTCIAVPSHWSYLCCLRKYIRKFGEQMLPNNCLFNRCYANWFFLYNSWYNETMQYFRIGLKSVFSYRIRRAELDFWYNKLCMWVASKFSDNFKAYNLRKLENIRKISKLVGDKA